MRASRTALLQELTERIRAVEARGQPRRPPIALDIPGLEDCLPEGGGLPAGALVEILSPAAGSGAWTLALLLAERACGAHQALVVADAHGWFYPPAAAKLGIDLGRCVVVRPASAQDAAAAVRQALGCAAVGATLGWFAHLSPSEGRRLQLAAEAGGGVGFLVRPASAIRLPSFAALRLRVNPVAAPGFSRRVGVEVVRCRGAPGGQSLVLEIDDATGYVRVPPRLAPSARDAPRRRASG